MSAGTARTSRRVSARDRPLRVGRTDRRGRGHAVLPVPPARAGPGTRGRARRAHLRGAARPGRARVLALQGAVARTTPSRSRSRPRSRPRTTGSPARRSASVAEPGYVSFFHRHCSYVDQGRYAPMLERWFARVRARPRPRGDQRGDVRGSAGDVQPRHRPARDPPPPAARHRGAQRRARAGARARRPGRAGRATRSRGAGHRGAARPRPPLVAPGAATRRLTGTPTVPPPGRHARHWAERLVSDLYRFRLYWVLLAGRRHR